MNSINDVDRYLWGKVIKSDLFKNIYFLLGLEFEDTILSFLIYPKYLIISSINSFIYIYRQNKISIFHTFNKSNVSIDSYLITKFILNNVHITLDNYMYNTFLIQVKMNYLRNLHNSVNIQKSIFVLTISLMNKYFNGFKISIGYYQPLENSIRPHNYYNYVLLCMLK